MTVGQEIAAEHAFEAADVLRAAAGVEDPYLRADVVWEAVERLHRAALHLAHGARACAAIGAVLDQLEAGCEVGGEPPDPALLSSLAHRLDDGLRTFVGIAR